MSKGTVWIVGAGPGDPGLITVAGIERLRAADVIIYDRLVSPHLLKEARAEAQLIFVGKEGGGVATKQSAINELLVEHSRRGHNVVRLKGGDPFVFGRGGEESKALRDAGVPFQVVPGISAAIAVPAYAGIPVTHRGLSSSLAIVTGHEDQSKDESALHWKELASAVDTLVLLMGTRSLPTVIKKLIANGRSPDTPAAVIQWGTTPQQRTVSGKLSNIVQLAKQARLQPPTVAIIGEVVQMREAISWYETRPLFGKRVLVTRSRNQASTMTQLLMQEGALPVELPAIHIQPLKSGRVLTKAIQLLAASYYHWAIFTSVNSVELFFEILHRSDLDSRVFAATKLCAIGPATAAALAGQGLVVDLVPEEFIAEGILKATAREKIDGARVLLPRAEGARIELVDGLQSQGAKVDEVIVYRAQPPTDAPAEALAALHNNEIDIVTFTSSSTVRNLATLLDNNLDCLAQATIACIGPITAATAKELLGHDPDIVATEHTVPGLVAALNDQLGSKVNDG